MQLQHLTRQHMLYFPIVAACKHCDLATQLLIMKARAPEPALTSNLDQVKVRFMVSAIH